MACVIPTIVELEKICRKFYAERKYTEIENSGIARYDSIVDLFVESCIPTLENHSLNHIDSLSNGIYSIQDCVEYRNTLSNTIAFHKKLGSLQTDNMNGSTALEASRDLLVRILNLDNEKLQFLPFSQRNPEINRSATEFNILYNNNTQECRDPTGLIDLPVKHVNICYLGNAKDGSIENKYIGMIILPNEHDLNSKSRIEVDLSRIYCAINKKSCDRWVNLFKAFILGTYSWDENSCKPYILSLLAENLQTLTILIHAKVYMSYYGRGLVMKSIYEQIIKQINIDMKLPRDAVMKILYYSFAFFEVDSEYCLENLISVDKSFEHNSGKITLRLIEIAKNTKIISGIDAFLMHRDFGLSLNLLSNLANDIGCSIDTVEFDYEASKYNFPKDLLVKEMANFNPSHEPYKTDDSFKYTINNMISEVIGHYSFSDFTGLILKSTCFYNEKGGQVGDEGWIFFLSGRNCCGMLKVIDVKEISGNIWHFGILEGSISTTALLSYDEQSRKNTCRNHTAVHLLDHFIKNVLKSKYLGYEGNLVEPSRIKYLYASKSQMSIEEAVELEDIMNRCIQNAIPIQKIVSKLSDIGPEVGFDQDFKYPEVVTTIKISDHEFSFSDLCCGTHVDNTKEILRFKIIAENSQNSNIRRLIAYTGNKAIKCMDESKKLNTTREIPFVEKKIAESKKATEKDLYLKERLVMSKELNLRFTSEFSNFESQNNSTHLSRIFIFQIKALPLENKDIKNLMSKYVKDIAKKGYNGLVYIRDADYFKYAYVSDNNIIEDVLLRDANIGCIGKKYNNISQGSCYVDSSIILDIQKLFHSATSINK